MNNKLSFPNSNPNRWLVVFTIMLVAILEVLDVTIVNVSLPAMMGELGANVKQITWVLTSYIVSSAIVMPLTGFLQNQWGRKRLLIIDVTGFMISSMLCGAATSLTALVVFRILQGMFGASLIPLSQAVLRDTFPLAEQGKAMAIWGIGIMTAPVLGPVIGGFITENTSWRWIFYMNLPVCALSLILIIWVIKNTPIKKQAIDWTVLLLMAVGVGGLQLLLDQGNQRDWFESHFILLLLIVSVISLAVFIYRGLRKKNNIINLYLFFDRNFLISTVMLLLFCAALFSVLALQPIMLQQLFNYPALMAGWSMAPRGIASALGMAMVVPMMKHFGLKLPLLLGLALSGYGTYLMAHYNLQIDFAAVIWPGVIQGIGMGMFFVPLSALSLATITKQDYSEAAGLFSYGRMLGSAMGISVAATLLSRTSQMSWLQLGGHIQPFNSNLYLWLNQQYLPLNNQQTILRLTDELSRQASMVAFIDVYWIIALSFLILVPLILL